MIIEIKMNLTNGERKMIRNMITYCFIEWDWKIDNRAILESITEKYNESELESLKREYDV